MTTYTLIRIENLESNKEYYFCVDGNSLDSKKVRISKDLYLLRYHMAATYSCLHSATKGKFRRQYITVNW